MNFRIARSITNTTTDKLDGMRELTEWKTITATGRSYSYCGINVRKKWSLLILVDDDVVPNVVTGSTRHYVGIRYVL